MQPVLCSDVTDAARVLLAVRAADRPHTCAALFAQACAAENHVRQTGKLHPDWGDGTLAGAAHQYVMAPSRHWNEPEYLSCLLQVLQACNVHNHQSCTDVAEP